MKRRSFLQAVLSVVLAVVPLLKRKPEMFSVGWFGDIDPDGTPLEPHPWAANRCVDGGATHWSVHYLTHPDAERCQCGQTQTRSFAAMFGPGDQVSREFLKQFDTGVRWVTLK